MSQVRRLPSRAEVETYYERLWKRLGERALSKEDRARWVVIQQLLAHVIAERKSEGVGGERARILDLGCGRGWITRLIADQIRWGAVEGVDPLAASIEAARFRHPGVQFRKATASDLLARGESCSYDLVVSSEVIEHVPRADQQSFLDVVHQLLCPGGFLVLTTPRGELWERWLATGGRPQPVDDWLAEDELREAAVRSGYDIREHRRLHVPKTPLTWHGWIDKWILGRRFVRRLPLKGVRRRLQKSSCLYQAMLLRKPGLATSGNNQAEHL